MELETIFHPVSGEKGYFLSESDAELVKAVLSDFRHSRMQMLEHQTVVGDAQ